MKNHYKILFVILFISQSFSFAKTVKYVGYGITKTNLRNITEEKSERGRWIGIGLQYFEPAAPFFCLEIESVTKKFFLEDISWPADYDVNTSTMGISDIYYQSTFIDLALKIGYAIPIYRERSFMKLFIGPVLSMQYKTSTVSKKERFIWYNEETGPFKFDYMRCDMDGMIPNFSVDILIGALFSYGPFEVELRYVRSETQRKCLTGLKIHDNIDSIYFIFHFGF